jgi:dehydrogenase/reductase SDR family protein 12
MKKYAEPVQEAANIKIGAESADGVDMTGKVVVVTGANSGIGKELATYAAAKGAKLYMLCRSKDRAEKAKKDIIEATANDQIDILLADMGELSQVRKLVAELQEKESKVDVLVCNAGALFNERRESSEGREITFASHLLGGSYLLSQLLNPQLKAADEGRCIYVSSGGMYNTKFPDWEVATNSKQSPEKYDGQFAYAYAKRGQVLLAEEFTKTTPEITFVSAHPGWSSTPAVDDAYGDNKKFLEPMRSTWQGAEGIAWLMATGKNSLKGGEYYLDRKPRTKHLAGPFFSEGSYTKNTPAEVEAMMAKLKEAVEP